MAMPPEVPRRASRPGQALVAFALTCALTCAVALCAATPAHAEVQEEHVRRPYPVHALSDEPLRLALNRATPIRVAGRTFDGYTRWNVRWNYRWWRDASGRCAMTRVTVSLRTEVQLPELLTATEAQRAMFDRYIAALDRHEQGHVQIGRDAARAVQQALASLPEAPDCPTLESRADALGNRLVAEYADREREYDRTTRHGATQGARLE